MAKEENTTERWLPVVGFEGFYEVSDLGRVRSIDRVTPWRWGPRLWRGKILSQGRCGGYLSVKLCRLGKYSTRKVHRLVLESFTGVIEAGHQANHLDFDPSNNRLENLEWTSQLENIAYSVSAGRRRSKISATDATEIRRRALSGESQRSLADAFGLCQSSISLIVLGKNWKHTH